MEGAKVLDLEPLAGDKRVPALTGKERGIAARKLLSLDDLDAEDASITVRVPDFIGAISSSFFLGLFADSLRKFDSEEKFLAKYNFDATPVLMEQITSALRNGLMRRGRLIH
jgi:hypothetical protein